MPHPPPKPPPGARVRRRQAVLARKTSSGTSSIADAVVTKNENLFLLTDRQGTIPGLRNSGLGLYLDDCRYLDRYEIRITPKPLHALSSTSYRGYRSVFRSANQEFRLGRTTVAKEKVAVLLSHLVDGSRHTLYTEIRIHNFSDQRLRVPVVIRLDASFDDVFVVRGLLRKPSARGRVRPVRSRRGLLLRRLGEDGKERRLAVGFSEPPSRMRAGGIGFRLMLPGRGEARLLITMQAEEAPARPRRRAQASARDRELRPAALRCDRGYAEWVGNTTRMTSDDPVLNEILERSLWDLFILHSRLDHRSYIAAGTPWFATLFGRDSILSALQLLAFEPRIAEQTLRLLAEYQGRRDDPWRDEQPGRILHELRLGEMAGAGEIPHTPYYGTIDATPLFLILLCEHAHWTGSTTLLEELEPNVGAALAWIDGQADSDGDGYIDYTSEVRDGMINQGWKDSGDAVIRRSGGYPSPPIALVEAQAYVYKAKSLLSRLLPLVGREHRGRELEREARALKTRFNRDFWCREEGHYALGLEAHGRPLRVLSSNAGHALWGGIASGTKARATVRSLMAPELFSGWGVRTLSEKERVYNPLSYHLGSVWPHDNAMIAVGFRDYGHDQAAARILFSLIEAALHYRHYRLPELFCGFARSGGGGPVPHPTSCHPQAWAAGTIPYLIWNSLGLRPEGLERRLRVVRPILPELAVRLKVEGLRVGPGRLDLEFSRTRAGTRVEVLRSRGGIEVVVER